MLSLVKVIVALFGLVQASNAFAPISWAGHSSSVSSGEAATSAGQLQYSPRAPSELYSQWEDNARYEDAFQHNTLRTDVRIFLTQRALQSFFFLLVTCRDPHTVKWLEETYAFGNLEDYHGTGAFNLTQYSAWDTVLLDMLDRPQDVVVVSAKRRGRGHGGWSKENPFLEERWVEFDIDIDPPSLATRILSVREQIAKEWVVDLDTIMTANNMILESYNERLASGRKAEEGDSGNKERAFDRTNAMMLLSNTIVSDTGGSSPYRKGNFDLLILLMTQESVHRVLRDYREARSEREVSFAWLREFYVQRVTSHFDGDQKYGRADDFVDELLLSSPAMREVDGKVELVDPQRVAEEILSKRSEVAQEWKDIATTIPEEHTELRKALFAKQMSKYSQPIEVVKDPNMGAFE